MVPYWVERRTGRQRAQLAKIELLEPKQHNNVAEYNVAGILYPGKLDTDLITKCSMVDAPGGAMPLRDWLKHLAVVDAWPVVVSRPYTRAAAYPEIPEYFRGVHMEQPQRHFLAALMIVMGQGTPWASYRECGKPIPGAFRGAQLEASRSTEPPRTE